MSIAFQTIPDVKLVADREALGCDAMSRTRQAQQEWSRTPLQDRLSILRRCRHLFASSGKELADLFAAPNRSAGEAVVSELLPLTEAVKFVERAAPRVLRPVGWGRKWRPLWLWGTSLEITREPFGVVLIIGPENYPLFLPGVQAVQALAAGNAVLVKPAPGCTPVMALLRTLLLKAGLDEDLFVLLPESVKSVSEAINARVDKVFFTGSTPSGREVISLAGRAGVPVVAELSGNDAVFVCEDANIPMTAKALGFGLRFNGSETCVAPRRVFVHESRESALLAALSDTCGRLGAVTLTEGQADSLDVAVRDAIESGGSVVTGEVDLAAKQCRPVVIAKVNPSARLLREGVWGPVLAVVSVRSMEEALALNILCPYALGAAVFGESDARKLASRIIAGVVVINDLIVPHADPRLPFEGRGASGFGVTRGAEGLLEMTRPKAISTRRGTFRPHLNDPSPLQIELFLAYMTAAHGRGIVSRLGGFFRILKTAIRLSRTNQRP